MMLRFTGKGLGTLHQHRFDDVLGVRRQQLKVMQFCDDGCLTRRLGHSNQASFAKGQKQAGQGLNKMQAKSVRYLSSVAETWTRAAPQSCSERNIDIACRQSACHANSCDLANIEHDMPRFRSS